MVFRFSNTFVLGILYVHHKLGHLISQLMMYWSYPIKDNHSFWQSFTNKTLFQFQFETSAQW
jgi:hypothetical protein